MIRILVVLLTLFITSTSQKTENDCSTTFNVVLTTIPPRFGSVSSTIRSLMEQEIRPAYIFIFIPLKYARFSRLKRTVKEMSSNSEIESENFRELLIAKLSQETAISALISLEVLQIITIEKDWGPVTKFAGILFYYYQIKKEAIQLRHPLPDYWVVCDDDVHYRSIMLSKYHFALSTMLLEGVGPIDGLTHFSEDYRIAFLLDNESQHRTPIHVQGVDTFMISNRVFESQHDSSGPLSFETFRTIVQYFHQNCPSTFYQDDYIISFLLNMANITLTSIWNNDNMAEHIEGVSKSNFQMHMHQNVFVREHATKKCIVDHAQTIYFLVESKSSDCKSA